MNEVVFVACALAVAASVQAVAGFGFGMVAMGLLPLVLPVTETVPIVALLGAVVSGTVLFRFRRSIRARTVLPMLIGTLLGVPVGVGVLAGSEPGVLRPLLGAALIAFSVHGLVRGPATPPAPEDAPASPAFGAAAGVASGVLGGAFNVGGPPLIVYVAWRGLAPDVLRATLQTCFFATSCVQLPLLFGAGFFSDETLLAAGAGAPSVAMGLGAGLLLASRISRETFRRIVLALLLVLGVWYVARGIL